MTRSENLLLIAYDGSELARRAIERAAQLSQCSRAVILHVHEPTSPLLATPADAAFAGNSGPLAYEAERIAEEEAMRDERIVSDGVRFAERLGLSATADSSYARGPGGIADAIVRRAADHDAILIVIGSHGRSPLGAALLGSVSMAVLHRSSIPVLVVPSAERRAGRQDADDATQQSGARA